MIISAFLALFQLCCNSEVKTQFSAVIKHCRREGEKWKVCFRLFRGWKSFRNYVWVWKMSVIKIGKNSSNFLHISWKLHVDTRLLDYRITRETSNVSRWDWKSRRRQRYRLRIISLLDRKFIHFFFASRLPSDATGINRIWVCDLLSIAIVFILRISLRSLVTFMYLIVIHPFPDTRVNIYVFCSFPFLFHVHVFTLAGYLNFRYFTRT